MVPDLPANHPPTLAPRTGRDGPHPPTPRRERAMRTTAGVLVTDGDLSRIADGFLAVAGTIELRADGRDFADADELVDFVLEEMVVERLGIEARDGDDRLRFSYRPSEVVIEVRGERPAWHQAFAEAADLLQRCQRSESGLCDIAAGPDELCAAGVGSGAHPWIEAVRGAIRHWRGSAQRPGERGP